MTASSIIFRDLTLGYGSHPAVHHLSGTLAKGSLTAVVGANGSGKSTLMKGIVGILKPMAGAVEKPSGGSIAYLPQQSELDRDFPARVVDLAAMGLWPRRGLVGRHRAPDRAAIAASLTAVGLEGFGNRSLDTLSGGQLQRALFARVLVQDADIILLDEPFNGVDATTLVRLLELIARWHGEGRTVVVVAHDLGLVREHFPNTLLIARRLVAWGPTADTLSTGNLARARRFDEAWHDDAPWCEPNQHPDSMDRQPSPHSAADHVDHAAPVPPDPPTRLSHRTRAAL